MADTLMQERALQSDTKHGNRGGGPLTHRFKRISPAKFGIAACK
jgi:hypothetical protein